MPDTFAATVSNPPYTDRRVSGNGWRDTVHRQAVAIYDSFGCYTVSCDYARRKVASTSGESRFLWQDIAALLERRATTLQEI